MSDKKKLKLALNALEKISNPIAYLSKEAEKNQRTINGMIMIDLANSASYLKSIALDALGEINSKKN